MKQFGKAEAFEITTFYYISSFGENDVTGFRNQAVLFEYYIYHPFTITKMTNTMTK
jgi:hypothetical protein